MLLKNAISDIQLGRLKSGKANKNSLTQLRMFIHFPCVNSFYIILSKYKLLILVRSIDRLKIIHYQIYYTSIDNLPSKNQTLYKYCV